jgi:hypothetical protein
MLFLPLFTEVPGRRVLGSSRPAPVHIEGSNRSAAHKEGLTAEGIPRQ